MRPSNSRNGASRRFPHIAAGTRSTGTGGWIWVVFAKRSREAARGGRSSCSMSRRRATPRASARRPDICRCVRASIAITRRFVRSRVRVLRDDAERRPARPAVAIYNAISSELQVAIGSCHQGDADTGQRSRRGVARVIGGVRRQAGRARAGAQRRRPAGVDPDRARCRLSAAIFWRARRRRRAAGGCCRRSCWSRSSSSIRSSSSAVALTDSRRRRPLPLHARRASRAARRPQFYGMIGVTRVFVGGRSPAAGARLRCSPGCSTPPSAGGACRNARGAHGGGQRMGDSGRPCRRDLEDPADREPLGHRQLLAGAGRVGPAPLLSSPALALGSVIVANTWRGYAPSA